VVAQQTNARTAQPGWWELLLEANICIAITHVLCAYNTVTGACTLPR
jgi:hypothetical protein